MDDGLCRSAHWELPVPLQEAGNLPPVQGLFRARHSHTPIKKPLQTAIQPPFLISAEKHTPFLAHPTLFFHLPCSPRALLGPCPRLQDVSTASHQPIFVVGLCHSVLTCPWGLHLWSISSLEARWLVWCSSWRFACLMASHRQGCGAFMPLFSCPALSKLQCLGWMLAARC